MLKLIWSLTVLLMLAAVACSPSAGEKAAEPSVVQQPRGQTGQLPDAGTPTWIPAITGPVTGLWRMAERPVITSGNFTFAVHAVFLAKDWTTILYSLSGPAAGAPLPLASVGLRDDQGRDLAATKSVVLANVDGLQLGVIRMQPRQSGASEMQVRVRPAPNANPLEMAVARKDGPVGEDHILARQSFSRDGYLEQAGYRISFNSFALQKGDRIAQTQSEKGKTLQELLSESATRAASNPARPGGTPTIVQPDPTERQLAGGKQILDEATLRIENLQSHQVNYLFAEVLEDGEVKGALLQ